MRIEHRVREALPVAEVVGVALQVGAVLLPRHLSRPGAVGKSRRLRNVLHRRRPGVVVPLVVLGPEWFEDELGRLESKRDREVGRDELGHGSILGLGSGGAEEANRHPGATDAQVKILSAGPAATIWDAWLPEQ